MRMVDYIFPVLGGMFMIVLFTVLFSTIAYEKTFVVECRTNAMQKNYSAVEVQAICK